ncbi:hypothetical protein BISA_1877 [Bifidobacterium saguini DSM 23967]|uniref:Uncharacterized protein n=1 Tax=Bifidobacterium saguini DSM 23967 TaxID=1437607 RepID=A0A087D6X7_9BIFI|nr:hypothetical protein [Bifidobacterium saguini]KFI91277.1 hypothetical protein BISA_1877 [Bifidobacterium saguini DSM 23967]
MTDMTRGKGGLGVDDYLRPFMEDHVDEETGEILPASPSAPVPSPSANWSQGLDAASATAVDLTGLLSAAYRAHHGKDPSASMVKAFDTIVRNVTDEPPREPEYGPGLWSSMPQRSWESMALARPLDWTGAPTRIEIDLMMMHTIRYGEWLCREFPDWEQTLPSCWPEHDAIVQEVFALKCYADVVAGEPTGGLYAPSLMQNIRSSLSRVKEYLGVEHAERMDHAHHMSSSEAAQRRRKREREYVKWFARKDGWHEEPPFTGQFHADHDFVSSTMLAYGVPPRDSAQDDSPVPDRLRAALGESEHALEGYLRRRDEIASMPDGEARESSALSLSNDSADSLGRLSRVWNDYRQAELKARERLERAVAAGDRRLADASRPIADTQADGIRRLREQASQLMRHAGDPNWDGDSYRPAPVERELSMARDLERLSQDDSLDSLERLARLIPEIRGFIGGEA